MGREWTGAHILWYIVGVLIWEVKSASCYKYHRLEAAPRGRRLILGNSVPNKRSGRTGRKGSAWLRKSHTILRPCRVGRFFIFFLPLSLSFFLGPVQQRDYELELALRGFLKSLV